MNEPFWQRKFPQLYKCKRCGGLAIMKEPEPWAGHACDPNVLDDMKKAPQPIDDIFDYLGEWEFVIAGKDEIESYLSSLHTDKTQDGSYPQTVTEEA